MKIYSKKSIIKDFGSMENFQNIIRKAKDMWRNYCTEYVIKNKNIEGTFVIGSGIEIKYLSEGCKNFRYNMIISKNEITNEQQSSVWEHGVNDVLKFLSNNNIEATYCSGTMD